MAFEEDDVFTGMIAYFRIRDLRRHPQIETCGGPTDDAKPRPFVCYAEADGRWYWTYLTGTWNPQRRTIARRWLRLPPFQQGWLSVFPGDLIVSDGSKGFVGPAAAFAACSTRTDRYEGLMRPVLLAGGLDELHQIIRGRGGPMPGVRGHRRPAARSAA